MVNTFVTADTPEQCAKNLDYRRLGKQRVEAYQILNILTVGTGAAGGAWHNHPAAKMWLGHTDALKYYINCMIDEWVARGYSNTMKRYDLVKSVSDLEESPKFPWWFTCKALQLSHKAALLRKDPKFYEKIFILTEEERNLYYLRGYIWPSKLNDKQIQILTNIEDVGGVPEDVFEPLGTGVPAQFRISQEEVEKWQKNPLKNPRTNRSIKPSGNIYKDYEKAAQFYFAPPKVVEGDSLEIKGDSPSPPSVDKPPVMKKKIIIRKVMKK